jgi:hypothetical protein
MKVFRQTTVMTLTIGSVVAVSMAMVVGEVSGLTQATASGVKVGGITALIGLAALYGSIRWDRADEREGE